MKLFSNLGHNCNGLSVSVFSHWAYVVACCLYFVLCYLLQDPTKSAECSLTLNPLPHFLKFIRLVHSKKALATSPTYMLVHCTIKVQKSIRFMPFFSLPCPGHRSSSILCAMHHTTAVLLVPALSHQPGLNSFPFCSNLVQNYPPWTMTYVGMSLGPGDTN